MTSAVVGLPCVRVREPEVGPEIDDREGIRQLGRQGGGLPVRQGEEDEIGLGQHRGGGLDQRKVRVLRQVRMDRTDRLTGPTPGRQRTDADLGMRGEQAEQLSPGIAGGAGDRSDDHGLSIRIRA